MEKKYIDKDAYETELEILKSIDHKNIAKIKDLFYDKKRHY